MKLMKKKKQYENKFGELIYRSAYFYLSLRLDPGRFLWEKL